MAKNVNGKLLQGTDEIVNRLFNNALWAYVNGEKTKEQALADFRTQASKNLKSDVLKSLRLILNKAEPAAASNTTSNTNSNPINNTSTSNSTTNTSGNNKYLPKTDEMQIQTDSIQGVKSTGKLSIKKEK